jgi:hypothetical protein
MDVLNNTTQALLVFLGLAAAGLILGMLIYFLAGIINVGAEKLAAWLTPK